MGARTVPVQAVREGEGGPLEGSYVRSTEGSSTARPAVAQVRYSRSGGTGVVVRDSKEGQQGCYGSGAGSAGGRQRKAVRGARSREGIYSLHVRLETILPLKSIRDIKTEIVPK